MTTLPAGRGKELMASHEHAPRAPPPRTFKPLLAAVLLLGTAAGGFFFSGALVAAPMSPWVTGDHSDISGQVRDENDRPLANVTVAIDDKVAVTNDTGRFELSGVPVGRRVMVVDSPGFRQVRFITVVSGGNPVLAPFVLTPGNGTEVFNDVQNQHNFFYTCGGLSAVFSAMALLGGLLAAQRRKYALATAGGLVGMGILPLFPLSTVICLGAVVLLLFSRSEFQ